MTPSSSTASERSLAFLKANTCLGALPEQVVASLVGLGHTKRYAKGETIFQRGDPGDNLMVILSGRVKITNITANAREVVLNFLGAGDVNGEIAILDGRGRCAGAVALEDSEVFVLHRRDVLPVLSANPDALLEIIQLLCEKLRAASAMVEANTLEMAARTATGLLRLAHQHGRVTPRGVFIDLKLSQRDLGSYLGLSRENVSRELGKLGKSGLIEINGSHITVLDEDALAAIAEHGA
jgi:CRP-like cAMP-binding protein